MLPYRVWSLPEMIENRPFLQCDVITNRIQIIFLDFELILRKVIVNLAQKLTLVIEVRSKSRQG